MSYEGTIIVSETVLNRQAFRSKNILQKVSNEYKGQTMRDPTGGSKKRALF